MYIKHNYLLFIVAHGNHIGEDSARLEIHDDVPDLAEGRVEGVTGTEMAGSVLLTGHDDLLHAYILGEPHGGHRDHLYMQLGATLWDVATRQRRFMSHLGL